MRAERGQTTAEYMGILLVVAVIVGALIASGLHRDIADAARSAVCKVAGESCEDAREPAPSEDSGPDRDADGVSDRNEERASTNPFEADSDGDRSTDAEARAAGSNPRAAATTRAT